MTQSISTVCSFAVVLLLTAFEANARPSFFPKEARLESQSREATKGPSFELMSKEELLACRAKLIDSMPKLDGAITAVTVGAALMTVFGAAAVFFAVVLPWIWIVAAIAAAPAVLGVVILAVGMPVLFALIADRAGRAAEVAAIDQRLDEMSSNVPTSMRTSERPTMTLASF